MTERYGSASFRSDMKYAILILISLIVNSCKIQGEFKGLFSYFEKTQAENPELFQKLKEQQPCELYNSTDVKVVVINGASLKNCLSQYHKAVVYVWSPLCRGKQCFPLEVVQRECIKKNLELFIVAEYYDGESMAQFYKITHPIFGIDTEYYRTDLTNKYLRQFVTDLTNQKMEYPKFMAFKDGVFERAFSEIEQL